MSSTKAMIGIALLWVALSALIWVPTSEGGTRATVAAILGFAAFAAGMSLILEGLKQGIVEQLRQMAR